MEMANQLMGVTMHEPGVSRLVAVDFAIQGKTWHWWSIRGGVKFSFAVLA
jgi:hypothetical protein